MPYAPLYREFDTPLMRRIRVEAYGEDIGQHSWVSADELRADAVRLGLGAASRVLDLGSGPCGPLTFLLALTGCIGVGLELDPPAIESGQARARRLGVEDRFSAHPTDLNGPWPTDIGIFDAVLAIDVLLHVRDRLDLLRRAAGILRPGGRLLFTDAGVVSGAITSDEIRIRSFHGLTQFVPEGWNERLLALAGFTLMEREDRTSSVVHATGGRLAALRAHREELEQASGADSFAAQCEYLATARELAARGALSRFMYLAKKS